MIEPTDLLKEALFLVQTPYEHRGEARRRTCVSRAYYAAFHAVRSTVNVGGNGQGRGGMHRQFLSRLGMSSDPSVIQVGRLLDRLYAQRLKADYHLDRDIPRGAEINAVKLAERIASMLTSDSMR